MLALGCIVIAFIADHFKRLPLFPTKTWLEIAVGVLLLVFAVGIVASARRVFVAHGTNLNPYRPTNAVVVTGVYRFSRNPIYIAFMIVLLAFALFANSLWFVLLLPLLLLMLHFGVVKREEAYLLGKFGDSYREYCDRVRRWI